MKIINLVKHFIIILACVYLTSCADKEQAIKYKTLRTETDKLISQIDLVLKDQKVKYDSLHNIGNDYIAHRILTMDIDGVHNAIMETLDVQESMSKLKAHLESIKFHCTIIEKACSRFGYLLKGKRKIKRLHIKSIYDTNSQIIEITGGLTPKENILKYLPKKNQ
jgi:hypothetical protein